MFPVKLASALLAVVKGAQISLEEPRLPFFIAAMSRINSQEKPAFVPNQNLCMLSCSSSIKEDKDRCDHIQLISSKELPNENFRVDSFSSLFVDV